MSKVYVKRDEPIDSALRKFKSKVKRDGLIEELRKREYYEKPSQKKRREKEAARRRAKRKKTFED